MISTILDPVASRALVPELANTRSPDLWVYRYEEPAHGWVLSVATHAAPGSGNLSLGGFRIAPAARMASSGFTVERESIALAIGMEEKVWWSRLTGIGGPLAKHHLSRIVGGKCVLAPTPGSRVGEPLDTALLDFAVAAFLDIEATAGIHLITGQDLGHGTMSTGESSLSYLNERYRGSVQANTAIPTGEGNVQLLLGMLRGMGLEVTQAIIGLVGCGNIGMHVLGRLRALGATVIALESNAERRAQLSAQGIRCWVPDQRVEFLAQPVDAIVVNALGGSLDATAVAVCVSNPRLALICGSENLVMPDSSQALVLQHAGKIYAPTELGGMVGYLTAVEEYLAKQAGCAFTEADLFGAAQELERVGFEATQRARASNGAQSFEDAVLSLHPVT